MEFDVKITSQDMYRFHMYHMYTGFHGIVSIVVAIIAFVAAIATWGDVELTYSVLYIVFGVVFLCYLPLTLWGRAKRQIAMSEVLQQTLHYSFDEEGVHVTVGDEAATLPWKQIYKMVSTKHNILIYSNRINAYIIPRASLGGQYEELCALAGKYLKNYQNRMKQVKK
ncbi:MAG: YcxB family protein [Lachnospiraceae bacterium]|nr:YcxB family protein [Lachnospiraceae bacterium]MDE7434992.1 YcxB family protein [Lachnospiraceae bacterium]